MGGVFASANFYALRTEGQTVFQRIYSQAAELNASHGFLRCPEDGAFLFPGAGALLPFVLWKALGTESSHPAHPRLHIQASACRRVLFLARCNNRGRARRG